MNTVLRSILHSACATLTLASVCRAAPQDYWHQESAWMMTTGASSSAAIENAYILEQAPGDTLYVVDADRQLLLRYTDAGDFVNRVQDPLFDDITGADTDLNGNLWLSTDATGNGDLLVYSPALIQTARIELAALPGATSLGLSINSRSELFVAHDSTVRAYNIFGVELRNWTTVNTIVQLAVGPEDTVYVVDASGVSIYDRLGNFIRRFSVTRSFDICRVGNDATVYLYDWSRNLYFYDSHGNYLRYMRDDYLYGGENDFRSYSALLPLDDGRLLTIAREYAGSQPCWLMTYRRSGYAAQGLNPKALPLPRVLSISQRTGAPVVDIDYDVHDFDSPTVDTALYALRGDETTAMNLDNYLPMESLIEGTDANVGANTPTGQVLRVTWEASADITTNVVDLTVRVLARDSDTMLSFDFITIPVAGGQPAFTINRVPLFQADLLPLWFWLLASGDDEVAWNAGEVSGTVVAGGSYNGQLLATGAYTTQLGAEYLFDRMDVRLATTNEVTRAREGSTPGTVNAYQPRFSVEQHPFAINNSNLERPERVNEYGFDTHNWEYEFRFHTPPALFRVVKKQ